ncbi:hypothetical protein B0T24DRAFT_624780 [Lasiosphaeria ovina]|uniref:Ecp2 effector protein-like domain-containing protein n=1 Tax=Lasiosphaeria ovina TaxID=92902 RepID=A0AAE0N8D1_9PEZI|nr:hypothetical protein B0T24DRAFT_624780 [Lasiosphaeria ovina]
MRDNLSGPGAFTIIGEDRQLASFGTCAFGANPGNLGAAVVGTEDIRDLVASSIAAFKRQSDGKVGSKGSMACGPIGVNVDWGLYHT